MRWHAELILEGFLAVWLCARPDGRKWFQALICCNFLFEIFYLIADRIGRRQQEIQLWWALIVIEIPFNAMSLIEAARLNRKYHLWILAWWVSLSMACAWIRFYPYTGYALIAVNQAAFIAWIAEAMLSKRDTIV